MSSAENTSETKLEDSFTLLKQGAEAKIYVGKYLGMPTVVKERFQKKYRHPDLDSAITKDRIKNESRSIARCKVIGVRTPCLYLVDMVRRRIYMEYFTKSMMVKDYFITFVKSIQNKDIDVDDIIKDVAVKIGVTIRRLHNYNIIHGDLTTSNMLLVPIDPVDEVNWSAVCDLEVAFIDFGLSYVESSNEDKGVDLYVLERALISTHNDIPNLFDHILRGYKLNNRTGAAGTLTKFEEVRARGRKRTMVG